MSPSVKVSRLFHWCHERNMGSCKVTVQQIAPFFVEMHSELRLTVPPVKGYWAALNHASALAGTDLAINRLTRRMFISFERNRLPREIKPP